MYSLLVVDDEQYAVEGVMEAIDWKSIGIMAVYGAYSSEEAKNIIRQHDIQVIVCDIEMAEESGLDFLRWMRTEGYFAKLIFLTAHARFDYAKESITLGATEYLMKPVDHDILKDTGLTSVFAGGLTDIAQNEDLFISNVFQKAKVTVDEKGTEAAAVTQVEIAKSAYLEPETNFTFTADHPFVYTIDAGSTNLFIGVQSGF